MGSARKPLAQHGILQTWDSISGALLRKLTENYDHPPLSVKPRIIMEIEDSAIPGKAKEPARFEAEEALTPLKVKAQI